jgi:hypothetical protein
VNDLDDHLPPGEEDVADELAGADSDSVGHVVYSWEKRGGGVGGVREV